MLPSLQKIVVLLVAVILLGFFGYSMFIMPPASGGSNASSTAETNGGDILTLVEKLKMISIDQDLFREAKFADLEDFSRDISPELQGRVNPFATIGSDIFSSSSNFSSSTQTR